MPQMPSCMKKYLMPETSSTASGQMPNSFRLLMSRICEASQSMNEPFQALSTKPKTVPNAADATRIAPATIATVRTIGRAPPFFSLALNLVPQSPDGLDVARVLEGVAHLLAQVPHVHRDGA